MIAGNVLKSTAIRLAAIYITLFVIADLGANVAAYQMVVRFLDDRLNANVMERFREIEKAYDARGLSGATEMIDDHGPAISERETIYALWSPDGRVIAGNAALPYVRSGFSSLKSESEQQSGPHYKLFKGPLGNNELVVGVSYSDTDELARIVLLSFGSATAITLAIGMVGAVIFAYRTRRRIYELSATAHSIGHGELSQRLPISSRMDEIDLLSSEINVALARLESSVNALKQVTTDVAHDLKTPIGRTFLVLEDALLSENEAETKDGIEVALGELRSIADTFDALLRIAQIESRDRTAHFAIFDLNALVADIHETYDVIATDAGYVLTLNSESSECLVNGDPNLVRQLLANLLSNSMRHTPVGCTIHLQIAASGMQQVFLSVSDNGPGIPAHERERVFDRFYRLEKSRTTPGSGLGLSLVRAVVELHGGKIKLLDNNPGLHVVVELPTSAEMSRYL